MLIIVVVIIFNIRNWQAAVTDSIQHRIIESMNIKKTNDKNITSKIYDPYNTMVQSSWPFARVHPVHEMNAEQRQTPADLWTTPTDLSHRPACRLLGNYIHWHLLLLSPKADTHFTIPQRVEGWVDLDSWLYNQTVYLPASSHSSK